MKTQRAGTKTESPLIRLYTINARHTVALLRLAAKKIDLAMAD